MAQVKVFKGSLPEILFGPFLNTLSQVILKTDHVRHILVPSYLISHKSLSE